MRVAGYIRVSTEEQAKEGYSLDAQREKLSNFCRSQDGWDLIDIYPEEGKSAKDLNRPELQRLLQDAEQKKFDVILVYRLDRLTRSVSDLYDLLKTFEKNNIMFRSSTEIYDTTTAMGKLFITIVAAMAQWERENLSERVRFGMEELVRKGNWHGGPVPYGYNWEDKEMHSITDEFKVLKKLREIYMSGEGLGSTAKKLNALGYLRRGSNWSAQTVWYVLDNPFYAGRIRYGEKKKNGKYASRKKEDLVNVIWSETGFPAVYSWDEYLEHKERMKRKEFYGHSKKREYRFTGVLRCARCGATLIGRPYRNKKKDGSPGEPYYNYICSSRSLSKGCDLPLLKQDLAEALIREYIGRMDFDSNKVPIMESEINYNEEIETLQKELRGVFERRKKWQYMYVEDLINGEDLRERKKEEDDKETIIQDRLMILENSHGDNKQKEHIQRVFGLPDVWDVMDDPDKREFMQMIFKEIVIECSVKNGKTASGKGKTLPFYIKSHEFN
ncbi:MULTISPECIES: recombinase family protein [Paenibacillus]|uniref:Site-specific DNA recombinase n=1 Tax=Paenibacillus pabuli TaxID=1472 RepID=A0A855Y5Z4_9BACL|nr:MULTISPECIES: recombinase family protein [Paenibacillus]PWW37334.1 site-specific DNA recombinase [Paenibacillus pabuli]PXW05476.1 site-specific DNA recombinase [Paenibacillus taichungensis]